MTACMFISPFYDDETPVRIPTFLADTVGTKLDSEDGAVAILPSTIRPSNTGQSSTVILVRKLNIFGRSIICAAGDGRWIQILFDELQKEMALNPTNDPVSWARDRADAVNRHHNSFKIGIVACYWDEKNDKLHYIFPPGPSPFEYKTMGACSAVGSGADKLWSSLERFDNDMQVARYPLNGWQKGDQFAATTNGLRLVQEMLGATDQHWGGHLEWATFDPNELIWKRGPSTLTIVLSANKDSNGGFSTYLLGRVIAYDPGPKIGRILSVVAGPDGDIHPNEFLLVDRIQKTYTASTNSLAFWSNWRPELVTVVVTIPRDNGQISGYAFLVPDEKLSDVTFLVTGSDFSAGLGPELHDVFSRRALDKAGFSYNPLTEDRKGKGNSIFN